MLTESARNGDVSFWYSQIGLPRYRPALPGPTEVDVAIVGSGFTGLWAAYYLAAARPDLKIAILEKEFAGFGASGRNGGWLSSELAGSRPRYAATHGRDGVVRLLQAMRDAVDEVIAVAAAEGIDADIVKNGLLEVARNPAQVERAHERIEEERSWGAGEEDFQLLTANEARHRITVQHGDIAVYTPHCARVQPAKLVTGLARAVERRGVTIYEQTQATSIVSGSVHTDRGLVRAPVILRCLEGFIADIRGERRDWLPMNSSMIVTEPLSGDRWDAIGWDGTELLGDLAHAYMYAQRTADGRIAIGGRGVPYRYASRTDDRGATQQSTIAGLSALLADMFPAVDTARVEHAWCGVLGVPRDWCATVTFDRESGLGTAGGYVGSGLTTTNLAGRTLADLVAGHDTELTSLPWVGRRVRRWEPEPLRWLGVHAMYALYRTADNRERRHQTAHTSRLAAIGNALTGR